MGVVPLNKTKIVKKRIQHAKRFQSDRFLRVGPSWRRPRGIDNKVRRRYTGTVRMPKIGYGSNKKTRFLLPCGLKKITINTEKEIELLLMNNRTFAAEIAQSVSGKKRTRIVERARELNVRVTNPNAKVRKVAKE